MSDTAQIAGVTFIFLTMFGAGWYITKNDKKDLCAIWLMVWALILEVMLF